VDDFMVHVYGAAEAGQGLFNNGNGAVYAGAKAARIGEQYFHFLFWFCGTRAKHKFSLRWFSLKGGWRLCRLPLRKASATRASFRPNASACGHRAAGRPGEATCGRMNIQRAWSS
jgi:hypothetical protein